MGFGQLLTSARIRLALAWDRHRNYPRPPWRFVSPGWRCRACGERFAFTPPAPPCPFCGGRLAYDGVYEWDELEEGAL